MILNVYLYEESWDQQDLVKRMNYKHYSIWRVSGIQQNLKLIFFFKFKMYEHKF